MSLLPSLRPFIVAGSSDAPHTLEIFLDFVCPYSAKISLNAIDKVLRPLFAPGGKYEGKTKLIFRSQVQPWHSTSTLVHEAAIAFARVAPQDFWSYAVLLFQKQEGYFDIPASTQSAVQIRESLAKLADQILGSNENALKEFRELLKLKQTPNGGNDVTDELKYTIKFSRQNGIHVSPTALWDGLIANEISSSWGEKEWLEFLKSKISE